MSEGKFCQLRRPPWVTLPIYQVHSLPSLPLCLTIQVTYPTDDYRGLTAVNFNLMVKISNSVNCKKTPLFYIIIKDVSSCSECKEMHCFYHNILRYSDSMSIFLKVFHSYSLLHCTETLELINSLKNNLTSKDFERLKIISPKKRRTSHFTISVKKFSSALIVKAILFD